MPFVKQESSGNIIAIQLEKSAGIDEELQPDHPGIGLFLYGNIGSVDARQKLIALDQEMVRILEDLIDLMDRKDQFEMAELPRVAQERMMSR